MALINCPECGKEISDRAQSCIHCGCPVQEILQEQKEMETPAPETMDEYLSSSSEIEQPEQDGSGRKKWFIVSGAVLLAAVIAVVLFLVLKPKNRIPDLGLKTGMTNDEIVEQMKTKGYAYNEELSEKHFLVFSVPEPVLETQPSAVQITLFSSDLKTTYIYLGTEYNYASIPKEYPRFKDLEETLNKLKEKATILLGEPRIILSDYSLNPVYRWETDESYYELYNDGKLKMIVLEISPNK